MRLYFSMGST
uniref:Uncharacterized protein n=1 Tax=Lepeophtheirus salmonis TaxID=72036 RepID=A0A0K2U7K1_LEPSM